MNSDAGLVGCLVERLATRVSKQKQTNGKIPKEAKQPAYPLKTYPLKTKTACNMVMIVDMMDVDVEVYVDVDVDVDVCWA